MPDVLNKIKEVVIKAIQSKEADVPALKKEVSDRQIYDYWMSCIRRAKVKRPIEDWEEAERKLSLKKDEDGKTIDKPYINDFRALYETGKAYIDQREASFKITPARHFMRDPEALKRAECESVLLEYIWREQNCQISESRKLDSSLVRNVGYTLVGFDTKKWLPSLKYLSPKKVGIDPNCEGVIENAGWCYYEQDISFEQFTANLKTAGITLTEAELDGIRKKAGSELNDEQLRDMDDADAPFYRVVTVYHVFARNDAAIRIYDKDEEQAPSESLAEELKLNTPRRYLQFVGGLAKPVMNKEEWPFDLDDDEFPITDLIFNTPPDDYYGFTDNVQMSRMDTFSDNLMADVEKACYWASRKKFVGSTERSDVLHTSIDDFMNKPSTSYLPDMLDSEGNPKIKMIDVGQINPLLAHYCFSCSCSGSEASSKGQSPIRRPAWI